MTLSGRATLPSPAGCTRILFWQARFNECRAVMRKRIVVATSIALFTGLLCAGFLTLIGCLGNFTPNAIGELPGGFILHRLSRYDTFIARESYGPRDPVIPSCVTAVGVSGEIIGATRHPLVRRSSHDPNDSYMIADETRVEYWLIVAKGGSGGIALGPLSKSEFDEELQKWGVSSMYLRKVFRL